MKFDYVDDIARRKHIIVDKIGCIRKESNNLDETKISGLKGDTYLEFENRENFMQLTSTLRLGDARDFGKVSIVIDKWKSTGVNSYSHNPWW